MSKDITTLPVDGSMVASLPSMYYQVLIQLRYVHIVIRVIQAVALFKLNAMTARYLRLQLQLSVMSTFEKEI